MIRSSTRACPFERLTCVCVCRHFSRKSSFSHFGQQVCNSRPAKQTGTVTSLVGVGVVSVLSQAKGKQFLHNVITLHETPAACRPPQLLHFVQVFCRQLISSGRRDGQKSLRIRSSAQCPSPVLMALCKVQSASPMCAVVLNKDQEFRLNS